MALSNPYPFTDNIGLPAADLNAAILAAATGALSGATWGSGVATFLQTPSSANLRGAVTDETGTGALVFATSPTLVTPVLGVATGTSLALSGGLGVNGAGLPLGTVNAMALPGSQNIVFNGSGTMTGNLYFQSGWKYVGNGSGGTLGLGPSSTIGITFIVAANNAGGAGAAATLITAGACYVNGDLRQGAGSALATAAVDGFFLIATCAGAPTGIPTNAGAGQIPMIFDRTNNRLYMYNSGWKSVVLS